MPCQTPRCRACRAMPRQALPRLTRPSPARAEKSTSFEATLAHSVGAAVVLERSRQGALDKRLVLHPVRQVGLLREHRHRILRERAPHSGREEMEVEPLFKRVLALEGLDAHLRLGRFLYASVKTRSTSQLQCGHVHTSGGSTGHATLRNPSDDGRSVVSLVFLGDVVVTAWVLLLQHCEHRLGGIARMKDAADLNALLLHHAGGRVSLQGLELHYEARHHFRPGHP